MLFLTFLLLPFLNQFPLMFYSLVNLGTFSYIKVVYKWKANCNCKQTTIRDLIWKPIFNVRCIKFNVRCLKFPINMVLAIYLKVCLKKLHQEGNLVFKMGMHFPLWLVNIVHTFDDPSLPPQGQEYTTGINALKWILLKVILKSICMFFDVYR